MHAGIAIEAFQHLGVTHDVAQARVHGARRGKLGVFGFRLSQRDLGIIRDHLAVSTRLRQRDLQRARHIANHGLCAQLAKGHNLRHAVRTIFLLHILDGFAAVGLAEVHVEIRGRDAFRIQKAFENQIKTQWINLRNAQ